MLCDLYIAVLAAVLPLYTGGTYVMLGDGKYALFLRVSLFCLGAWALTALAGRLLQRSGKLPAAGKNRLSNSARELSPVDICMLFYGAACLLSAAFSSYGMTAWTGYQDWHMGALSQIVFVAVYFFVSRSFCGSAWPIYLWEAAFFAVTALGFCSRLGFDPLGLLQGFRESDWEYSHLISTLGNINWFCGYCAVALAMPVAGYLKAQKIRKYVLLYIVCAAGLVLLCIQGSDIGPVLAAVCLGVCLLAGRRNAVVFARTMLLAAGVFWGLPCCGCAVRLRGEAALQALPADGVGISVISWGGWWILGAVCAGAYFVIRRLGRAESDAKEPSSDGKLSEISGRSQLVVRGLWLGTVLLAALGLLAGGALYVSKTPGSDGWSSGRGALWKLSLQGFWRGGLKQKLLGAGPDCFAEYIYSVFAPFELPAVTGHWADAVFANAHNQWLNHLINTGILGLAAAVAIAAAAFARYRRYLPGVLALVLYGLNSLVSFQQVLSTPLFFLLLGICEYTVRRQEALSNGLRPQKAAE